MSVLTDIATAATKVEEATTSQDRTTIEGMDVIAQATVELGTIVSAALPILDRQYLLAELYLQLSPEDKAKAVEFANQSESESEDKS